MKKDVTQHFGQVILHDSPVEFTATDKRGACMLVGAGPGGPEYLTLRAIKAIETATVLLVDDMVSETIVALASPSARVVWVLHAVREGHLVVRLRGGSPFSFAWIDQDIEPSPIADKPGQKRPL